MAAADNDPQYIDGNALTFAPEAKLLAGTNANGKSIWRAMFGVRDGADETKGAKADGAWDGAAASPTIMAVLKRIGAMVFQAGENHLGEVGGNSVVAGATLTRPATATTFASGQLVANNAAAGSVTPIAIAIARKNQGTGVLTGLRLSKSTAGIANASFRAHLFKIAPVSTVGDAGVFAGAINGVAAMCVGYVDITMDQVYSDGAKGFALMPNKVFDAAAGSTNLYALIEARGAYASPASEVFTLVLEALRD